MGHRIGRRPLAVGSALVVASIVAAAALMSGSGAGDPAAGTQTADDTEEEQEQVPAQPPKDPPERATSDEDASGDPGTAEAEAPEADARPSSDDDDRAPAGESAEAVLTAFIGLTDAALADPGGFDDAALTRLATGSAVQELRSLVIEYEATGLRQSGVHEIVGLDASSADDGEVTIDICLDRTNVQLLREDGSAVLVPDRPQRSLQRFVLQRSDVSWQVSGQLFPEPDTC